ncbi:hypothetical protein K0504_01345 [Neiella marina]|uniref:Uncharacterized protein n=1 Tax=Neiella holothuriorum TaxID=2870530 RepID=A0ABS7EBG1_9GAMM|nr:hypothetical protein [Neiella holothuriorum]
MRCLLLFIGWSSIVGSIGDGALGLYAFWLVMSSAELNFTLSLDAFLSQYVSFIYWVKQVAFYVMPKTIAHWLFGLPALIYFPLRILMSLVIGWWALAQVKKIDMGNG